MAWYNTKGKTNTTRWNPSNRRRNRLDMAGRARKKLIEAANLLKVMGSARAI